MKPTIFTLYTTFLCFGFILAQPTPPIPGNGCKDVCKAKHNACRWNLPSCRPGGFEECINMRACGLGSTKIRSKFKFKFKLKLEFRLKLRLELRFIELKLKQEFV
ncbi:hypothetical protein FKW77_003910 [Venturia effusa]|uniref:Extracellular membrane protein CFEM domain-containing protein n=1 Tax=Venturia effusa TaxID=50376 RepID=A0A517KW37_9PEZI|nr:hypothetical protein FKW77_003910 [Venturia effusa]